MIHYPMIHYPIKPFLLSHSFGENQSQEQPTPGMEQFFVDIGIEVSDIDVKPPPYTKDQIKRIPNLVSKYGMEIRPD